MKLRAYFDDSGVNQQPLWLLGGFLAESDQWAAFEPRWREALTLRPRLDVFKASEAYARRDERIPYLLNLIKEHRLNVISGRVPSQIDHPYLFMFNSLIGLLLITLHDSKDFRMHLFGKNDALEQIDFVFDIQLGQMERLTSNWNAFKQHAPERIRPLLVNPPVFQDDRNNMALQAADLWAWRSRAIALNAAFEERYDLALFKRAEEIESLHFYLSREMLELTAMIYRGEPEAIDHATDVVALSRLLKDK